MYKRQLQELPFAIPTENMDSVQNVQFPANFNRQRRRASMHDAIDYTKINKGLYDKVSVSRTNSPIFKSQCDEKLKARVEICSYTACLSYDTSSFLKRDPAKVEFDVNMNES